MWRTARRLVRYRGLLAILTVRELKARYRGSVMGWLWSLVNPLVLLAVYTFVFGKIFHPHDESISQPYALFLISGLFPWIWLQSSLLEGAASLLTNAGLIRKATFPAEVLPMVPVLANLVHLALALPVIAAAVVVARHLGYDVGGPGALLMPLVVLLQLPLIAGLSLGLAALNAHFKDVRDLLMNVLTVLFFMTPILYSIRMLDRHDAVRALVAYNPLTPFILAYQETLFFGRLPGPASWLAMAAVSAGAWALGTALFGRLSDTLVEAV